MTRPLDVLLIEPYFGGSHRAWAEGLVDHSVHRIDLVTMPARWWKWRMRGAAPIIAERLAGRATPDVVLVSDMIDLPTLKVLAGEVLAGVPTILYFHESQLTYPDSPQLEPDIQFALTNWLSALSADVVVFNSHFHREVFAEEMPRFLRQFPEFTHEHLVAGVIDDAIVLEPGVDLSWVPTPPPKASTPRVIWNHRWEHDKDPAAFFAAVDRLASEGLEFELAVCGENFRRKPGEFEEAEKRHRDRIVHFGFAETDRYHDLLVSSHVVVSTARQEFFGIAMVEAMAAGCFPVLPRRLAYPELVGRDHAELILYEDDPTESLRWALTNPAEARRIGAIIGGQLRRYDWSVMGPRYDELLEDVVR